MRHKSFGFLVFMIILGMIVGSAVGEGIGAILPGGVVKDFFLRSVTPSLDAFTVDLVVFTFTIGFSLNVNLMAVLGVVFAVYLFRWY